eukprot:PhF_6_TR10856/c0_g1_i1/m.17579
MSDEVGLGDANNETVVFNADVVGEDRISKMFLSSATRVSIAERHQRQDDDPPPAWVAKVQEWQYKLFNVYPRISCTVLALCVVLDMMSVILYITIEEDYVDWNDLDDRGISTYSTNFPTFVIQSCLCAIFTLEWLVVCIFNGFRKSAVLNKYTVVCMMTCFPMNVVSLGACYDWDSWKGAWLPHFLRIWWAYRSLKKATAIRESGVTPLQRDMVSAGSVVICILVTAASCFQVTESLTSQHVYWYESLYLIFVTFSTSRICCDLHSGDCSVVFSSDGVLNEPACVLVRIALFNFCHLLYRWVW